MTSWTKRRNISTMTSGWIHDGCTLHTAQVDKVDCQSSQRWLWQLRIIWAQNVVRRSCMRCKYISCIQFLLSIHFTMSAMLRSVQEPSWSCTTCTWSSLMPRASIYIGRPHYHVCFNAITITRKLWYWLQGVYGSKFNFEYRSRRLVRKKCI